MSAKTTNLIQDKLAKLNEYVAWFDSDEFALEQAVDKFAAAEKLAEEIEQDLAGFKNEINVIKKKFDQE